MYSTYSTGSLKSNWPFFNDLVMSDWLGWPCIWKKDLHNKLFSLRWRKDKIQWVYHSTPEVLSGTDSSSATYTCAWKMFQLALRLEVRYYTTYEICFSGTSNFSLSSNVRSSMIKCSVTQRLLIGLSISIYTSHFYNDHQEQYLS